jgi:ectoine hydroxylase-related dioxygenase (phytanoyl-CoA dioxygenase family)
MAKTATVLELPPLTTDLEEAKGHLDEFGIARIADALDGGQLDALRTRLTEQAAGERAAGVAFFDAGGANQRLWNLPSKGEVFCDLLRTPVVRTLARHILGGDYCLSSHTANIAGPGGEPMVLHTDQGYAPRSVDMALTMNVMWMLVDFTEENGGTRLVPGSHLTRAEPPRDEPVATVAGVGPAGTALVFDGRIWHGTGANITADQYRYGVLTYFCRPWIRPQENYTLSTHPDVLAGLDDEVKALLGFRVWRTLGGVQGPWGVGTPEMMTQFRTNGFVERPTEFLGELRA